MAYHFSHPLRLVVKLRSFSYSGDALLLQDVEFEVKAGECLVILGASGAGKTTLLKLIDGLLKDYEGEVLLDGQDIRKLKPKEIYSKMGLLFQNPDEQLFAPTVFEDVAFGPRNMGFDEEEVIRRVLQALDLVELSGFEGRSISQLSFGQKKRVALAGLLAMGHEVLLLDEPTLGLDPIRERRFLKLLKRLQEERSITLVIATHQVDIVPEIADRVLILSEGKVFFLGPPEEIFGTPQPLEKVYLRLPLVSETFLPLWERDGLKKLPLTVEEGREILKRLLSNNSLPNS
ncbi:MAG: ATP-binding cassette domain-containing protein [Caldimicrobium sp.]|jgi:cobalt/nickel transport system ATP-binding protein|nr:ATP-binding cassette domain-containing protein [Caldimicrobium sp.]